MAIQDAGRTQTFRTRRALWPRTVVRSAATALLLALGVTLASERAWACACGCGVFDVGVGGMMSTGEGGMAYLEYDTMDQTQNWLHSHSAPAGQNADKEIQTDFYTVGLRYNTSREWAYQVQVPYWVRKFKTLDDDGNLQTAHYSGVGDIRIEGIYTGLSADLSTGLSFGLKLPTGSYTEQKHIVDRDTEIGSGSTDVLIGIYHVAPLSADNRWTWFGQAKLQSAFIAQDGYYPGSDVNAALGVYFNAGEIGPIAKIAPLLQLKVSNRMPDSGPGATIDPTLPTSDEGSPSPGSGYTRVIVAPGLEATVGNVRLYAEVGVPVYTYTLGNELVATTMYKFMVGYLF
jgi:hypothetical protein